MVRASDKTSRPGQPAKNQRKKRTRFYLQRERLTHRVDLSVYQEKMVSDPFSPSRGFQGKKET